MQLKHSYWWFKSALTEETCDKILELGKSKIEELKSKGITTAGTTFSDSHKQKDSPSIPQNDLPLSDLEIGDPLKDVYIRDSDIAWLNEGWLYDLLVPFVEEANEKAGWKWQYNWHESLQFTRYENSGFYGWHQDGRSDWCGTYKRYIHGITKEPLKSDGSLPSGYVYDDGPVGKVRKISMTVNLCDSEDYEGGNLKFDFGSHVKKENRFHTCEEIRPKGSIIVFPSFVHHCVTPVTKGTRYSLVMWTLGDPWK